MALQRKIMPKNEPNRKIQAKTLLRKHRNINKLCTKQIINTNHADIFAKYSSK